MCDVCGAFILSCCVSSDHRSEHSDSFVGEMVAKNVAVDKLFIM